MQSEPDNNHVANKLRDADANDDERLHPLFSSPEGDVILGASGGTILFRVHSVVLKMTSGWFRSMFSLPQKCATSLTEATYGIIYVDEDAHTLEFLLRMICGLPVLPIDSYDLIDSLLFAAEKYDMPGPMSIIRVIVMTPLFLDQPFRLYAAACRFGWDREAKSASTRTLTHNLYDRDIRPQLQKLSTSALLDLLELHRTRREGLRRCLNNPPFVPGGTASCVACHEVIDYHTWRELKYKIVMEMDVRPLGDTIVNHGLAVWPEAQACWNAKCSNRECGRSLYDKVETSRVIAECIDGLPQSV